ncbi:hypothetical protein SRL2020400_57310 [Mycobacterium kiyosense]|nr:hypothetical protein SRL2020400_57310 [Mycobacterium kiyosense]
MRSNTATNRPANAPHWAAVNAASAAGSSRFNPYPATLNSSTALTGGDGINTRAPAASTATAAARRASTGNDTPSPAATAANTMCAAAGSHTDTLTRASVSAVMGSSFRSAKRSAALLPSFDRREKDQVLMYHSSITCYTDTAGLFTLLTVPGWCRAARRARTASLSRPVVSVPGWGAEAPPGGRRIVPARARRRTPGGEARHTTGRALGCDHSPPGLYRMDFRAEQVR